MDSGASEGRTPKQRFTLHEMLNKDAILPYPTPSTDEKWVANSTAPLDFSISDPKSGRKKYLTETDHNNEMTMTCINIYK